MRLVPLTAAASLDSNESVLAAAVPELLTVVVAVAAAGYRPAPVAVGAGVAVESATMHPLSFPTIEMIPGYFGGAVVAVRVFVYLAPLLPRWPTRPGMVSVAAVHCCGSSCCLRMLRLPPP